MFDRLFNNPELLIPTTFFVCTALVFMVWIIAQSWKRVRQLDIEGALKKEMLDRGMSAEDIERVIGASTGRSSVRPSEGKPRSAYKPIEQAVRS
jgi:hypothetical protein